jgi:hypothetical protein
LELAHERTFRIRGRLLEIDRDEDALEGLDR